MKDLELEILKNITVLVVEDSKVLREKLKEILEIFVDKVYEAEDGLDALKQYDRYKPNIIFTDIEMPKMNGLDFIESIRKINKDVQIVVISAHSDSTILLRAIELHLVKYLVKPINYDALEDILKYCVKNIQESMPVLVELNDNVFYSFSQKKVINNGESYPLSNKEYQLIELLLTHRDKPVSKQNIHSQVWNDRSMSDAALKNFILRLRRKISQDNILTIPTIGYMIPKLH